MEAFLGSSNAMTGIVKAVPEAMRYQFDPRREWKRGTGSLGRAAA